MEQKAIEVAERFLSSVLGTLGETGSVSASMAAGECYINLVGPFRVLSDDPAMLSSLTHILRLHLRRQLRKDFRFVLDINGAVAEHRNELAARAHAWAEEAVATGRKVRLPPMGAADRRWVHVTLVEHPSVRTYSVGQGSGRRVVIDPVG